MKLPSKKDGPNGQSEGDAPKNTGDLEDDDLRKLIPTEFEAMANDFGQPDKEDKTLSETVEQRDAEEILAFQDTGETFAQDSLPFLAEEIKPGEHLLHYRINRKIGQGGMGLVFDALDTSLQRQVAIKTLHPHLSRNSEVLTRFQREARALAQLRHPNVVQIYALHHERGIYFFAMEFIKSRQSLAEYLESRNYLDEREAVSLILQILQGLEAIHRVGIVHRDIKPANIMLDKQVPRITDFGIAHCDMEEVKGLGIPDQGAEITAVGKIIGTPAYLAPECFMGKKASFTSDIYAAGIMFYEMLTGKKPFVGNSLQSMAIMHLSNDPVSVIEVNKRVSPALSQIVDKMIAKDPLARYQKISEVICELGELEQSWDRSRDEMTRKVLSMEMASMMRGSVKAGYRYKRLVVFGGMLILFLGLVLYTLMVMFGNEPQVVPLQNRQKEETTEELAWEYGKQARVCGMVTEVLANAKQPEKNGKWLIVDDSQQEFFVFLPDATLKAHVDKIFSKGQMLALHGRVDKIRGQNKLFLRVSSQGVLESRPLKQYIYRGGAIKRVKRYREKYLGMAGKVKGTIIYRDLDENGLWLILGTPLRKNGTPAQMRLIGVDLPNETLEQAKLDYQKLYAGDIVSAEGVIMQTEEESPIFYLCASPSDHIKIEPALSKIREKSRDRENYLLVRYGDMKSAKWRHFYSNIAFVTEQNMLVLLFRDFRAHKNSFHHSPPPGRASLILMLRNIEGKKIKKITPGVYKPGCMPGASLPPGVRLLPKRTDSKTYTAIPVGAWWEVNVKGKIDWQLWQNHEYMNREQTMRMLKRIGRVMIREIDDEVIGEMSLGDRRSLNIADGKFRVPIVKIPPDFFKRQSLRDISGEIWTTPKKNK